MAIDFATGNFLCNFGDDRGGIDVQRRENPLQMVGPPFKVLRFGTDRRRRVASYGSDKLGVRGPWTCGLRRLSARHQLANGRSNTLSLSHGASPWLGLEPMGSCYCPSARFYVVHIYVEVNSRSTKKAWPSANWARSGNSGA